MCGMHKKKMHNLLSTSDSWKEKPALTRTLTLKKITRLHKTCRSSTKMPNKIWWHHLARRSRIDLKRKHLFSVSPKFFEPALSDLKSLPPPLRISIPYSPTIGKLKAPIRGQNWPSQSLKWKSNATVPNITWILGTGLKGSSKTN